MHGHVHLGTRQPRNQNAHHNLQHLQKHFLQWLCGVTLQSLCCWCPPGHTGQQKTHPPGATIITTGQSSTAPTFSTHQHHQDTPEEQTSAGAVPVHPSPNHSSRGGKAEQHHDLMGNRPNQTSHGTMLQNPQGKLAFTHIIHYQ
jgi:hypothetical protein